MGGIFSSPKVPEAPKPDPEIARLQEEQAKAAADEKASIEERDKEEKLARARGLRGKNSLLSAGYSGFEKDAKKETLGA